MFKCPPSLEEIVARNTHVVLFWFHSILTFCLPPLLTALHLFCVSPVWFLHPRVISACHGYPHSACSTPSGIDGGSGRSTPSSVSTISSICPGDLKVAAKMAPNIPLEMELPGVKIVHAQFNTPMQLYSEDNIMETLQGQVSTALGEAPPMR